jgi:hypothetical protein
MTLQLYVLHDGGIIISEGAFARLITYFGNFVFGFLSLRLRDFLYDVFRLQGKMGETK